jgi:hypothetical protein
MGMAMRGPAATPVPVAVGPAALRPGALERDAMESGAKARAMQSGALKSGAMKFGAMKSRATKFAIAVAAMVLVAAAGACPAAPPRAVPVEVGGSAEWDACGSFGRVRGLKPGGDGFLAVRAGPGVGYAVLDKLLDGDQMYLCRTRGDWVAIVYADSRRGGEECGVHYAIAESEPYRGPCKSGWVHKTWVEVVAG